MVSRPIVAGPLAGLLIGDPGSGLWVGALLEILSLGQLPVGASRYWDTGPAAVAGAVTAGADSASGAVLLLALGVSIVVGMLGGLSMGAQRRLNARLVGDLGTEPIRPQELQRRHLLAIGLDFGRAASITGVALALVVGLLWPLTDSVDRFNPTAALLVAGAASIGLGADLGTIERGRSVVAWFGVGALLSSLFVLWIR